MSLAEPRIIFGIHSLTPYSRSTGMPYGILKVLSQSNLELTGEQEQLFAGSNKFAWASESKTINTSLAVTVKAYPGFLFELFLGATVTDVLVADADGTISAPVDKFGTTLVDAVTGLASIVVIPTTGAASLKFGKYIAKATAAKTFKVYILSDIDFARGTDASYVDDTLEVATVVLTDTGGTTDVAALGLRFTSGSGTVLFTTGDTATFEVQPPFAKTSEIIVGKSSSSFPEFGALILAAKRSSGEMFEVDAHKCSASGMPINFAEVAYSSAEMSVICQYDSVLDRVFTIRNVVPS